MAFVLNYTHCVTDSVVCYTLTLKSDRKFQQHRTSSLEQRCTVEFSEGDEPLSHDKATASLRMESTARDKTERRVCYPNVFSPHAVGGGWLSLKKC